MYDIWQVGAAYVVGTAVGIGIFQQMIKERIIANTLDTLIDQEYVRSYVDDHGITHLHKWHELDDILDDPRIRINDEGVVEELKHEEDDTP